MGSCTQSLNDDVDVLGITLTFIGFSEFINLRMYGFEVRTTRYFRDTLEFTVELVNALTSDVF